MNILKLLITARNELVYMAIVLMSAPIAEISRLIGGGRDLTELVLWDDENNKFVFAKVVKRGHVYCREGDHWVYYDLTNRYKEVFLHFLTDVYGYECLGEL